MMNAPNKKYAGGTFAGVYCDEITLYPESFFKMLLSRLSIDDSKLFGTTNPDNPSHWLYKDVIANKEMANKAIFHYTLDDNPNLKDAYKESLRNAYTGLWYRRFYLGEWVSAQGAIYDMFDKKVHCYSDNSKLGNGLDFVSIDYGTQNPFTAGKYRKVKDTYYLTREYYYDGREQGQQKTDGDYVADLKKWLNGEKISFFIVDPSATSFIAELRKQGFSVILAKNTVLPGIQTISNLLSNQKYFVHNSCVNTIREFEGYGWDERGLNLGIERPSKVNDHCMDRDRYALFSTKDMIGSPLVNVKMPTNTSRTPSNMKGMI